MVPAIFQATIEHLMAAMSLSFSAGELATKAWAEQGVHPLLDERSKSAKIRSPSPAGPGFTVNTCVHDKPSMHCYSLLHWIH